MHNSNRVIQEPSPSARILVFQGDTLSFSLSLDHAQQGTAWIRTNIGHVETLRKEIIYEVEQDEPPLGRDWFDIPMRQTDSRKFSITVSFCEVGHFEAKCFFIPDGETNPIWPEGPNAVINVEPADTCCANIIYNAFVRQYGPNKKGGFFEKIHEELIQPLDENGYAVIPPSGTFRDLIKELDFIVSELGCRIIQLLPIHPTPTTYGRMGRFGSPYAALSFTAVDPALAEFDPRATPLEQFIELVDAVHEHQAKVLIDIAINHTGWAASLHETHPQWLVRDPDGQIEVPGAWGVVWADLTSLDYTQKGLWQYMADVFLTWCRRGVDGFRCDAGYMIPVNAWRYIIVRVREEYPGTIFLLEGLGGKVSVTRNLLNKANFNWAYSELFQNYDRGQVESYWPVADDIATHDGNMIHFAETHDNNRLADRSITFARMRTALCALCSYQGGFGFANGVEWYATEKINVHGASSLNWGNETNQVGHIRRLNAILTGHPAFHDRTELKMLQRGEGNYFVLLRHHIPSGSKVIVVANLDDQNEIVAKWNKDAAGILEPVFTDLISETQVDIRKTGDQYTCYLKPGQVICLTAEQSDVDIIRKAEAELEGLPARVFRQRLKTKVIEVFQYFQGIQDLKGFDPDLAAERLIEHPIEFCRSLNTAGQEPKVITWSWPRDTKRAVMLPPGHFLMVVAETSFRARMMDNGRCLAQEECLARKDGMFFALFAPFAIPKTHCRLMLKISVYAHQETRHDEGFIYLLSEPEDAHVKTNWYRSDEINRSSLILNTNNRGGMMRAHIHWGELSSRYDALLAANLSSFPEDRWIMLTRCRLWIVFQDFSTEICHDCFHSFSFEYPSGGIWRYKVPTGQGEHILVNIHMRLNPDTNRLQLVFYRDANAGKPGRLADDAPVRLILRPDIENRNFHETTKAYQGAEHLWPKSVQSGQGCFTFSPDSEHRLFLEISNGSFVSEPEWHYMIYRSLEAERGLDPDSDLFSPGYFTAVLQGGESINLAAGVNVEDGEKYDNGNNLANMPGSGSFETDQAYSLHEAMKQAMDQYVVKREDLYTVIAGFPWFLDWGRDTLIFVRGLIAAGKTDKARAILKQFGKFEQNGTLPNMIQGKDARNRETSDAPLWFLTACADLIQKEGNEDFLEEQCNGRTVRQVLLAIGRAYVSGTSVGVKMDPDSCLIFSPAHFTWMDTNYPAGTPRQGYPIEIQALWHAALSFFAAIDTKGTAKGWLQKAEKVRETIVDFFWLEEAGYLSDCLHAEPGQPAIQAMPDDALRPNQLFTLTLGAVSAKDVCRSVLSACEKLLVPGAVRSLADQPVQRPIPIHIHEKALNDPYSPYQGKYSGDEDTQRKPAYHNGTAWTWLFPSFCEAWAMVYGKHGRKTALAWLASSTLLVNQGCLGQIPEILDGDYPHKQRGCDAQAWGVSELVRVWELLAD